MVAMSRLGLLPPLLVTGCLVSFPALPPDSGGASDQGAALESQTPQPDSKAPLDGPADLPVSGDGPQPQPDQAVPVDAPPPQPDQPTPADGPPPQPDVPQPDQGQNPCLSAWTGWSCSTGTSGCTSTCAQYKLSCNKSKCMCDNQDTSVTCTTSAYATCNDCQAAFLSGCCDGL